MCVNLAVPKQNKTSKITMCFILIPLNVPWVVLYRVGTVDIQDKINEAASQLSVRPRDWWRKSTPRAHESIFVCWKLENKLIMCTCDVSLRPRHRQFNCSFNSLMRLTLKEISKVRLTGPLWVVVVGEGEFPAQRGSNNISLVWHHYGGTACE